MNCITASELKARLDNNDDLQLIDVREDYEFDSFNIGGINIPLDDVLASIDRIDKTKPIVFCCKSGKRSKAITLAVSKKLDLNNVYSLIGGLEAYQQVTEA
ncbi:MAG: rhodanese-like domain-containing protein [Flavobacteriales bacterium]|nr:rhodanese-like domain-containing protein [Flavobacteriales bacterium]